MARYHTATVVRTNQLIIISHYPRDKLQAGAYERAYINYCACYVGRIVKYVRRDHYARGRHTVSSRNRPGKTINACIAAVNYIRVKKKKKNATNAI